jgi:hypothetical protein
VIVVSSSSSGKTKIVGGHDRDDPRADGDA